MAVSLRAIKNERNVAYPNGGLRAWYQQESKGQGKLTMDVQQEDVSELESRAAISLTRSSLATL